MSGSLALEAYLGELRRDVEAALERVLRGTPCPPAIAEPLRYSLLGPGKRLRPCLTLLAAEAAAPQAGLPAPMARAMSLPAACAVEMIHTYSLVHDDLPAMDNDTLRRGRPTTHVVYGDGLAILAGDGLLTEAFGLIARWPSPALPVSGVREPRPEQRLRAIETLSAAAGVAGMVGGQAIDLSSPTTDAASLEDLHRRKTGALIRAAAAIGAMLVGASDRLVAAMESYAADLGLAFQIIDDVLDVEGSDAALGKTAGKDAAQGKLTFVALYGVAESRRRAADCIARAKAALAAERLDGPLTELADWTLGRTR